MGMFDYIDCEYPLPEGAPTRNFQSKDTPDQMLTQYLITEDGRLLNGEGELVDFDGEIEFYHSNICASGPEGYLTDDDKPAACWIFFAIFEDGKLVSVEGEKEVMTGKFAEPPTTREVFFNNLRKPQ